MTTSQAFHDRFAAQLHELLGDGIEVCADSSLTVVSFGSATLAMWTPAPADKRKPVREGEARDWVHDAARKLRSELPKYNDTAKHSARQLLDELARRGF